MDRKVLAGPSLWVSQSDRTHYSEIWTSQLDHHPHPAPAHALAWSVEAEMASRTLSPDEGAAQPWKPARYLAGSYCTVAPALSKVLMTSSLVLKGQQPVGAA